MASYRFTSLIHPAMYVGATAIAKRGRVYWFLRVLHLAVLQRDPLESHSPDESKVKAALLVDTIGITAIRRAMPATTFITGFNKGS